MPKRTYIRWDVHFGDLPLGLELLERFGPWGHCLFLGFICACKKNHIRGRISYASEAEGLAVLGYPCAQLVDGQGKPFTLDDFWTFLGQRKQTRRTRRGRVTNVLSTRWEQWQKDWRTADERERKGKQRLPGEAVDNSTTTCSGDAVDSSRRPSGDAPDAAWTRSGDAVDSSTTRSVGLRDNSRTPSEQPRNSRSDPESTKDTLRTGSGQVVGQTRDPKETLTLKRQDKTLQAQDPWDEKNHNNHSVRNARDKARTHIRAVASPSRPTEDVALPGYGESGHD